MIKSVTNSYFSRADKGSGLLIFVRLLLIWKGSLYKLVFVDLIAYLIAFYIINFTYRFGLNDDQRITFVKIAQFAHEVKGRIPFFFLLGFFVTGVIARWIQMYLFIPWLNRQAFMFEGFINGEQSVKSLRVRRTVLRYLNLAWILLMRKISDQIALRFRKNSSQTQKDTESSKASSVSDDETNVRDIFINFNRDKKIQETYGKIITDSEIRAFENIAVTCYKNSKKTYEPEYWIPIQWASRVIQKSFLHGYVSDPRTVNKMIEELDNVRRRMQTLDIYCGIMIPLVYTQVVIIAVCSYFLCELFASQVTNSGHDNFKEEGFDFYVPIFTIFNFLFMIGWLKVAMCVMNPFGDDDEDFPTSDILDDNLDVTSRSIAGELDMFPERLDPPPLSYECRFKIDPPDNLEDYLDTIDYDLEDYSKEYQQSEVKALEMKKTVWKRIENKICCKKSSRKTGDDLQMKVNLKDQEQVEDDSEHDIVRSQTEEENLVDLHDNL